VNTLEFDPEFRRKNREAYHDAAMRELLYAATLCQSGRHEDARRAAARAVQKLAYATKWRKLA